MTKFQIILTGVFGVFIFMGVLIFSTYRGNSQGRVTVTVWGTVSADKFAHILADSSLFKSEMYKVEYTERSEEEFDPAFVEALASGNGPDLFILPSDKIVKHKNKIFVIPYSVFTERKFKDSFIEGAEIYTSPEGVIAMPIVVDPLVMYWNRSIFNEARITTPPKYWDEFYSLSSSVSKKDGALNIQRSAVAFGEFANVSHAKDIISTLVMQAGSPIVDWRGDRMQSVFNYNFSKPAVPAEAAVNFYTEFSNPAKTTYSWNRSLPSSYNYFLGGDLALYFGFASEISSLQLKNPNLNFDVSEVPMSREGGEDVVYGRFYGLAITKSSKNPNAAFAVASVLSSEAAKSWSEELNLPPVQRALLGVRQTDAYKSIFFDSAIRARSWLDPEPVASNAVFKNMIESITSGRARTSEAISRADKELESLFAK